MRPISIADSDKNSKSKTVMRSVRKRSGIMARASWVSREGTSWARLRVGRGLEGEGMDTKRGSKGPQCEEKKKEEEGE